MAHSTLTRLGVQLAVLLLAGTAYAGPRGTTITGEKTAAATYTETLSYDWTIEKSTPPDQVPYVIPQGETQYATYSITVRRLGPTTSTERSAVSGEICVNNTGTAATRGLAIQDRLEVFQGGVWVPVTATVNIPVASQIAAGGRSCFPYSFNVDFNPNAEYRNHATASIDNFVGFEGTAHEIQIFAGLEITKKTVTIDETATVTDLIKCPTGFTCTPLTQSWDVTGNIVIPVEIAITNNSAPCGQEFEVVNTATLVESDTGSSHESSATIDISTGSCPPDVGCVRTQGYWGNSPAGEARLIELVPGTLNLGSVAYTAAQLAQILDTPVATPGPGANALLTLAHQLIAAKLNILNGASGVSIASTIATADALIGSLVIPPVGSGNVSPSIPPGPAMISAATTLDQYNNGNLGVPHCD